MKTRTMIVTALGAVSVAIGVLSACADSIVAGTEHEPPAPFLPSADADAIEAGVRMCNSYDCPSPFATCPANAGLCTTNLSRDIYNCGACDEKCELSDGAALGKGTLACVDGQCRVTCDLLSGDCNGDYSDGCEADLETDPSNCGACGVACSAGEICWRAACGCPPGYAQCGDTCTKLNEDPQNCSACGKACQVGELDAGALCDGGDLPPHYGAICSDSACSLGCTDGFGDCNQDTCGDGCESDLANDPKNCGGCGIACGAEQVCFNGKCQCQSPDLVWCGFTCVDPLRDWGNCGACGNLCPGNENAPFILGERSGHPLCELGHCSFYCPPGRADCDHRIDNGCETDTDVDPKNCGGCGVQCDLDGGQPCAAGACLTKPCPDDAGGPF